MRVFIAVIALCLWAVASAQITKKLDPREATKLRKGELVRYYKVRPTEIENKLPYQVLIVVMPTQALVKTNKWSYSFSLNRTQQTSLKENLGFLDMEHLNMFKHEKGSPEEEHNRLFYYLSAKKGDKTITWNSKNFDLRGQVLLVEMLEVFHYFAREEKEK